MKKFTSAALWFVTLALLVFSGMAWNKRQNIYDWYRLRNYSPPSQVAALAEETRMTPKARKIFYVNRPELNDRDTFSKNCTYDEHTIVLGCYVSGVGIYLFDIDDPRLEGIEQVTAAHEMLHAAYGRLGTDKKSELDALLKTTFESLNNDRILRTIESYKARDPAAVPNELHSILATEVRQLPEELETYYSQYFTDRQTVVEFSEKYEATLTAQRTKAATLESQISALKNDIESQEAALTSTQKALQRDRPGVNTEEEAVAYNQRIRDYNADIRDLNRLIERYNELIKEYRQTAVEAQELYKAIDSRPTL